MNLNVNITITSPETLRLLGELLRSSQTLTERNTEMAKTLAETLAVVTATRGQVASLIVLTGSIKTRLDEIIAGGLTPAQQAAVDAIFTEIEATGTAAVAALNANDDDPAT